jgi:dTMP kinase
VKKSTRGKRDARRRRAGRLITFEGIEGCGKSTQANLLAGWLREQGWSVVEVREPGGTDLGEALRPILLRHAREAIERRAELFLYLAARSQLVARIMEPALAAGKIVVADRFGDASVAYQGGGRELGLERVRSLVRFATGGLVPDRTYLLDLSVMTSLARVRARGELDRLEGEGIAFHRQVRSAYRKIAEAEPERVRLLRAARPRERIAESVRRDLAALLRST